MAKNFKEKNMKDLIKENILIRICYVCRKEKELNSNNFYKNKQKDKGYELCCKECSKYRLAKYKPKEKTVGEKLEYNNYRNEWRANQQTKGLCKVCKEKHLENIKTCEKHYLQDLSRRHLGTTSRWEELKNILIKQDYKCFYSGEKLILGLNASLDHTKPLSKHPNLINNIENLQWTTKQINLMKSNLNESEFLKIIKSISIHKKLE